MSEIRKLAAKLTRMERDIRNISLVPQMGHSSLEAGESVDIYDESGQVVGKIGTQDDGTFGAVSLGGPVPPVPAGVTAVGGQGSVTVVWGGEFADGVPAPLDLAVTEIWASQDDFETIDTAQLLGHYANPAGGELTSTLMQPGVWFVALVARSESGQRSGVSARVEVTVESIIDQAVIDDIEESGRQLTTELGQARTDLDAALVRLTGAESDIVDAFGDIGAAQSTADAAVTSAQSAQSAADAASGAASDASQAAAVAAGIADGKADVLIQPATPPVGMRKSTTLWIDTTGGANTPKRWSGSAWVVVTDKAATDAANAATAAQQAAQQAQSTADAAHQAAGDAQSTADLAMVAAGSKTTVTYSTGAPAGNGQTAGDTHRQRDSSHNIIAEWRWTGSAWQKQEITSAAISNLDVGKLTAGAANIATVVAQKIAAATGQFLELDVGQLTASGAAFATAVVEKFWAEVIRARKITTDMLLVGRPYDLTPGPGGYEDLWRTGNAAFAENSNDPSGKSLDLYSDDGNAWAYGPEIPIREGEVIGYRFYATYRGQHPTSNLTVRIYFYDKDGEQIDNPPIHSGAISSATWIEGESPVAPPGSVTTAIRFYQNAGTGTRVFRNLHVRILAGASLIVDGGIQGRHVAADAIEAAHIAAGAVTARTLDVEYEAGGKRFSLQPDGMRLFDDEDEPDDPTAAFTTSGVEYLAIRGPDPDDPSQRRALASMAPDGTVLGQVVAAEQDILLQGDSLLEVLNSSPRGDVLWASQDVSGRSAYGGNASGDAYLELMEVSFDVEAGRSYQISVMPLSVYVAWGTYIKLRVAHTINGSSPQTTSPNLGIGHIDTQRAPASGSGARRMISLGGDMTWIADTTGEVRALFWLDLYTNDGNASVESEIYNSPTGGTLRVNVIDLGTRAIGGDLGVNRTGKRSQGSSVTPPDPPKKKRYTTTWNSSGGESFLSNGAVANGWLWKGKVAQGAAPGTSQTNLRGVWLFPNLASTLAGADIEKIEIEVTNQHTNLYAGATAYFFTHTRTNLTSTQGASSTNGFSVKFGKGQKKWVTIPANRLTAIANGLKAGTPIRGFGLSTSGQPNYGYWSPNARLRITYVK